MNDKYINKWSDLEFEESKHVYSIGNYVFPSVSSKLKSFQLKFDRNIAKFVAQARTKKTGKKVSKSDVLKEWDAKKNDAAEKGTNVHNFAELYSYTNHGSNVDSEYSSPTSELRDPSCDKEKGVISFWENLDNSKYMLVALEQRMYTTSYKFAGTADVILMNIETGKYIICDYKTNEDLFKNYKSQKLLKPFDDLLDNSYNKYALQLSHYQLMFEEKDYDVEERWIIWLKPDENELYQLYKVEDYTNILKEYYESKNNKSSYLYFT